MQPWVPASLGAAVLIGIHYTLVRAASGRVPDAWGALILEGAATLGITASLWLLPRGAEVATTRLGVGFSALSGLAISGASILLFATLRLGGPVASAGTIVLGGGVTLSALVAPFLFHEGFTLRRAFGVALGLGAIAVLSREGSP